MSIYGLVLFGHGVKLDSSRFNGHRMGIRVRKHFSLWDVERV